MGYRGTILRVGDVDERFGARWDALPAGRADQADVYDSWAWHAAAVQADRGLARSFRLPAVLDGDDPVALLPVTVTRSGAWRSVGPDIRPRSRVVIGTEDPDPEVLGRLAETLAEGGARALALHRLPSRDPATHDLLRALRDMGYEVAVRKRSADRLAQVEDGWAGHGRTFKSFAKYARRFSARIEPLWSLTLDTYGTQPDAPLAEGFALYADLQARSWKGPFDPATRMRRAALLNRTEELGWARIYVLRIDGQPVAGHVWFRLGKVAIWMSTAHDQRLNALSPGTIVQWWAQERIFHDRLCEPPGLLDFLPGGSPQKDRLSPDRPPLLEVDAVRKSIVAGVTLPVRQQERRILPAVHARADARIRSYRERWSMRAGQRQRRVRRLDVAPGTRDGRAAPLDVEDAALRRYLAVAAGQPSPEATLERWDDGDQWWRVGDGPTALVRIGSDRVIREVVRLDTDEHIDSVAAQLATVLAGSVSVFLPDDDGEAGTPVDVYDALLRWPGGWEDAGSQPDAAPERSGIRRTGV
ncbi:MAG: GNAT family N-acetyltransferase [Propionibacteriales bacterium]|nr:GNAT family N-acetyltransferase [Propionibacteriales bacterium]